MTSDIALPQQRRLNADVAIIGAGSGGLVAASGAAQLGLKVVLFEKGEMGGDCLNYGCVPSKSLIAAARAAQAGRAADRLGVRFSAPEIDWGQVSAHVRGVIAAIAPIDSQERFEGLGVTVVREAAHFIDRTSVASKSVAVRARKVVIATGARAFIPPIPGIETIPYLTNETVFSLEKRPEKLVVLGGGAIGLELGQAFRRLGADVVIVEAARIMNGADLDATQVLRERLELEGVVLREDTRVNSARVREDATIELSTSGPTGDETISGTHLLVATGRRPVLEGLELERAGIAFDARGVRTDLHLRTTNPRVWAVGDVAGREQFTHAAGFQGGLFIRNALFRLSQGRADGAPIPRVVYTEPELAQVGLSEPEARAHYGDKVRVVKASFEENDRARTERAHDGFAKIIVAPNGRILGAVVAGEGAGETIALLGLAISNKLKIGALTSGFVPAYPTRAEIVKRAAGQYYAAALFSKGTRAFVALASRLP